jgi:cobalt-zinc-cadmium efflux system membrane fusion protein
VDRETIGSINYDSDLSVQVFPPYPGTIIRALADLGAAVKKDQPLYTIKSPDLLQAETTFIGAQAVYNLTHKELLRARALNGAQGVSERELEQATSDEQTADGALRAARDGVRLFGKTEAEIDQMAATRRTDPALVVRSPLAGKVTARVAQPGLFVQPGTAPAPFAVANVGSKWMLASVVESDLALYRLGQPVTVEVVAFPGRRFSGTIAKIYDSVDPNTHRVTLRSEVRDPRDELRPGMLGRFTIRVKAPVEALAVPEHGVVREPDGAFTAWVTTDRQHFTQRVIQIGERREDRVQVLGGLRKGELVVAENAVFVANILNAANAD